METKNQKECVEKSQSIIPEVKTTVYDMVKATIDRLVIELQNEDCQGNQEFWETSSQHLRMLEQFLRYTTVQDSYQELIRYMRQIALNAYNGEDTFTAITLLKGLHDNIRS